MNHDGKSVCLYGPAGCGKTTNAPRIAKALGLVKVFEQEEIINRVPRLQALPPYGVLLICQEPPEFTSFKTMHYDEAMKIVRAKEH